MHEATVIQEENRVVVRPSGDVVAASIAGLRKIRDDIRAMATFRTLNLTADFSSLGRHDIIFCRNVAIYFNERDRISLFNRLGRVLERDGCLIIGAMESLSRICPQFESRGHLRSVYYTLRDDAAK